MEAASFWNLLFIILEKLIYWRTKLKVNFPYPEDTIINKRNLHLLKQAVHIFTNEVFLRKMNETKNKNEKLTQPKKHK